MEIADSRCFQACRNPSLFRAYIAKTCVFKTRNHLHRLVLTRPEGFVLGVGRRHYDDFIRAKRAVLRWEVSQMHICAVAGRTLPPVTPARLNRMDFYRAKRRCAMN